MCVGLWVYFGWLHCSGDYVWVVRGFGVWRVLVALLGFGDLWACFGVGYLAFPRCLRLGDFGLFCLFRSGVGLWG